MDVSGTDDEELRRERAEAVVRHEWTQFQAVRGDDGRADCQNDWPQFRQMRLSQFLTWPLRLLHSYAADLDAADAAGRNLLTEKYARMMASTEPERYARQIAPVLPALSDERLARQEAVIAVQVDWAHGFRVRYPHLGQAMRVLRTAEDTLEATSFETYLRGELGTYSDRTFAHYRHLVGTTAAAGGNLTEQTIGATVALGGFTGLDEAEAAQAR
ncbi:MAG: DUF4125 family protein [Cellulomonas sp.]|nr:DUF4125 family protein [Cellulomonas sp.]